MGAHAIRLHPGRGSASPSWSKPPETRGALRLAHQHSLWQAIPPCPLGWVSEDKGEGARCSAVQSMRLCVSRPREELFGLIVIMAAQVATEGERVKC
jgi:hypothetical protein